MHELSLALSILDLAAEEAAKHGATSVRAIHVRVGPLSGVVPEALAGAFAIARASSSCPEADLIFEEAPIRIRCPRCQVERPVVSMREFVCAECGAASAEMTQGREFQVIALEIE